MRRSENVQAALRLMGNPYASLSLFSEEEAASAEPSLKQKQAYFRKLENPHAFSSIFGDSEDNLWGAAESRKKADPGAILDRELDEVLLQYRPYVARNEWSKLMGFKPIFVKRAAEAPEKVKLVISRLQKFRFALLHGEKVEWNRAPASRIIQELEKILG
jgi:hypothetical protein